MHKPIIHLQGCEQSAFKLIQRAKSALYAAGQKKGFVEAFAWRAGIDDVVKHPAHATPVAVYIKALKVVKEYCDVR